MICKICKSKDNTDVFIVREMMFGFKDKFEYFLCSICGCLQIVNQSINLKKYYPNEYYSFKIKKKNFIEENILRQRARYNLGHFNAIGFILSKIFSSSFTKDWLKKSGVDINSKILDVGCGAGNILQTLQLGGYTDLTGIDPYIENDIYFKSGVKILKKELKELNESSKFDLIMLHHVLEHMPEPETVFKNIFRLLKRGRFIIIRIPIIPSLAWRKYGINWVQLDAPRHLFVHSVKSIQVLSNLVGFQIKDIVYDSTEFQFWGSEQYVRDIPLHSSLSYCVNKRKSIFSKKQINDFRRRAIELNNKKEGDQACFYLYKP